MSRLDMVLSLTAWMDPALKHFAGPAGIPVEDFSAMVGGEGIATFLEGSADFFTKGWLNKIIQGVAGAIASTYAIWGTDVPPRLRRELLQIGTHELLRLADTNPGEIVEIRRSLDTFLKAAERGDWNTALASVLTTPDEIQRALGGIMPPLVTPPLSQVAGQPPSYVVKPPPTPAVVTAPLGRYTIPPG